MRYATYSGVEWTYPDTIFTDYDKLKAQVDLPRGGHDGIQLLGEMVTDGLPVTAQLIWKGGVGPSAEFFEMVCVGVNENTDSEFMTTSDYSRCSKFVTRCAPFCVYDALRPLEKVMHGSRLALYIRFFAGEMPAGRFEGTLHIQVGEEHLEVLVECRIYMAEIPRLQDSKLGMLNFFCYENLTDQHGAVQNSQEYWNWYRRYVRAQLDMRCTHILLPGGEPIYDENKNICGFDFSQAEQAAKIAFEEGAPFICGAHIAHWHTWNETEYFLGWADTVSTLSTEGYLQMKLYFEAWAKVLYRNDWWKQTTQALADEPQTHNDIAYRAMAAVFRKYLPSIPIVDAVETVNLGGGVDVWVPKQDTYEKNKNAFDCLKNVGENIWFYTCAFPAGQIMNRSMDLPLTVSRLVLWMGFGYDLSGFLHWGFNYYIGSDIWNSACCPHKGKLLPAGDAHVVYPGQNSVWPSMRFEAQRGGAEDYELLMQLAKYDYEKAQELTARVCTSFRSYTSDSNIFCKVRRELLEQLDKVYCL
ncbi:MAG: DUF4091 domain-containing protein [Oscillospiraceae bacterium]